MMPPRLPSLIFCWLMLEILTLALLLHLIGWAGVLVVGVLTTGLGAIVLRKIGVGISKYVRFALAGGMPPEGRVLDGVLTGLGGLLLVLPGFLSDIAGLALASPSIRQWLARRLTKHRTAEGSGRPNNIDLSPAEWSTLANSPDRDSKSPLRRKM